MVTVVPLKPVTATICPRARSPVLVHPPSHQLQLPPLPEDDTKLGSFVSVIARYLPTLMPAAVPRVRRVEPASAPPMMMRGCQTTDPEPRLMTCSPPSPVEFRMVRSAPAPRSVTSDGI